MGYTYLIMPDIAVYSIINGYPYGLFAVPTRLNSYKEKMIGILLLMLKK